MLYSYLYLVYLKQGRISRLLKIMIKLSQYLSASDCKYDA